MHLSDPCWKQLLFPTDNAGIHIQPDNCLSPKDYSDYSNMWKALMMHALFVIPEVGLIHHSCVSYWQFVFLNTKERVQTKRFKTSHFLFHFQIHYVVVFKIKAILDLHCCIIAAKCFPEVLGSPTPVYLGCIYMCTFMCLSSFWTNSKFIWVI